MTGGQLTPPPTPTISPNTSNRYFEIAILFNLVERSGNYVFEDDHSRQGKGYKLCSGDIKGIYIERMIVQTLEGSQWIGNQKF